MPLPPDFWDCGKAMLGMDLKGFMSAGQALYQQSYIPTHSIG